MLRRRKRGTESPEAAGQASDVAAESPEVKRDGRQDAGENQALQANTQQENVSVASLVATYAAIGASRNAFVSITGLMVADQSLGITAAVVADVLATGTLVYTGGKLAAGACLDSLITTTHGATAATFLSNFGVALSLAGIAMLPSGTKTQAGVFGGLSASQALLWLWIANRLFQVVGWPCIAKIVAWNIPEHRQGGAWGWLSASSHIGRLLGTVTVVAAVGSMSSLPAMSALADWKVASLACAVMVVLLTSSLVPAVLCYRPQPARVESKPAVAAERASGPSASSVLVSGRFALIAINVMGLTCVLEMSQMLPLYVAEVWHVPASISIWASALYPAGAVASTLFGGWLVDSLGVPYRSTVTSLFLLGTVATSLCFAALTAAQDSPAIAAFAVENGAISVGGALSLILSFSTGFCSSFPYYVPPALFCSAAGANAGAVSSVLDGVAYLGSAVLSKAVMVPLLQAGPTPGIVAELLLSVGFPTGWMGAFLVLAVASSASFLAMVVFYNSGDNRKPGQAPSKPSVRL